MITISDTLLAEDVLLDSKAINPEKAVEDVAALLKADTRVTNWSKFYAELLAHPPCRVDGDSDFGICIPHVRSGVVNEMVMSASRLATPLMFPECVKPVRYVFCLGVPKELASDYLRIAGALMRIFTDATTEGELRAAKTAEEFVDALTRLETKL